MDCHMPALDGFEATQSIRDWEKEIGRDPIPIIAVSASAFQEDRDRCTAVGMNAFVPKPITVNSLQTILQQWLPADPATTDPATTDSATTPVENSKDEVDIPEHLFDREQFMEMKLITGDQLYPLLEKFRSDSLLQIAGMRDAARQNNSEAIRRCAHKLKGSAATLGAKILSRSCHRMEEHAREGNIDGTDEMIDAISSCLNDVIVVIDRQRIS